MLNPCYVNRHLLWVKVRLANLNLGSPPPLARNLRLEELRLHRLKRRSTRRGGRPETTGSVAVTGGSLVVEGAGEALGGPMAAGGKQPEEAAVEEEETREGEEEAAFEEAEETSLGS